ncbi:hypothetical protein GIB67_012736 [Kingdonia uniflora]|uniref:CASP-like protein n=1 Tax=Kingdonia uniflora TaxID=39325 RepID=A0A7J7NF18_9MAGN|nr:hypothetical protein GIB67_012736 [Kingdonia uniflora]
MANSGSTSITIKDTKPSDVKGKSAAAAAAKPTVVVATTKAIKHAKGRRVKKGAAVLDFFLRLVALAASLVATITLGTASQTLPFVTNYFQFKATFEDLPAMLYFVIVFAIASVYLFLSLPFSFISCIRPHKGGARVFLLICDTVMVALTASAASAATAIVYLAHTGNSRANWIAICEQFNEYCQGISGSMVPAFIATGILILLVVMSALVLRKI